MARPTPLPAGEIAAPTPIVPNPTPEAAVQPGPVHKGEGGDRWYPADPELLRVGVEAYVEQAEAEPIPGRLVGLIVPHAGYLYSGPVAGYAYRAMREAGCAGYTVVVIGDTHSGNGSTPIAIWGAGAFETPLGTIPVDEAVATAVDNADGAISFEQAAFQSEHPVENQLPFIQTVCPQARIVPVVIREPTLANALILSQALVKALGDRPAMIVASTDLSHYHPYEEARLVDEIALQAITSLDPQMVADSPRRYAELGISGEPLTMCSQGAVMAALLAGRELGADHATVLSYATSGDTPLGDRAQVVGYAAVALWQARSEPAGSSPGASAPVSSFEQPPQPTLPAEPLILSSEQRDQLLELARRTAAQFLRTETFPSFITHDPALLQPLGAFVTYRMSGNLRGCVGRLEGDRPAYLNVQYAAVAAALGDSRFTPVTASELDDLSLEITLLHPMRQLASPDQIQIGQDGVLMRVGEQNGALFLPQVPPEEGWDLRETLVNLCRKAGLPDDAWRREDARFWVFSGQWFGEGE